MRVLIVLALVGCEESATAKGNTPKAEDFAGREGMVYTYAVTPETDTTFLLLAITADSWEFRTGTDWDEAVSAGLYQVVVDGSLVVDTIELLPGTFSAGDPYEGYYGEYADTASNTVGEGTFAGNWIFARDLGPVHLALNGVEEEMVMYQDGLLDTGG